MSNRAGKARWSLWIRTTGGAVAAVLALGACSKAAPPKAISAKAAWVANAEAEFTTLAARPGFASAAIPEFDDEQRMRAAGGNTYGPLAKVVASSKLSGYVSPQPFGGGGQVLVALALVSDATPNINVPSNYPVVAHTPGWTCIYLTHSGNSETDGYTVDTLLFQDQQNGQAPPCPDAANKTKRDNIPVYATKYAEAHSPDDYPGAARLEETTKSQWVVGLRCGNAWCNLGMNATDQLLDPLHKNDADEQKEARTRVPGWFDEQELGLKDAAGHVAPGLRASLIPDRLAAGGKAAVFEANSDGAQIARVFIRANVPTGSKYDRAGLQKGMNEVWMHHDALASPPQGSGQTVDDVNWKAKVRHKDGTFGKWLTVKMTSHPGVTIPPTARWKWNEGDEGIWIACDIGCCEIVMGDM